MKVLLLGVGLQGRAALYDLVRSPEVSRVIAADVDMGRLCKFLPDLQHEKVSCQVLDVSRTPQVTELMHSVDAVIHLLPARFRVPMARLAVAAGVHFVDASYADPEYQSLHDIARRRKVSILPEFGLDPGIDLVLASRAMKEFDEVHELYSYGAGIPESSAARNALKYKVSWSFSGVLSAYVRPARMIREGQATEIPAPQLFNPKNVHEVQIDELGTLEAYPNGDAVKYVDLLGLRETIREAGRFSMRWPGHSETWRGLIALGFLDERAIDVNGSTVTPRQFTHDLLLPRLRYKKNERDIALIRVEVAGIKNGDPRRVIYQVLDYRDLESGLLAMQRTVGFTASIGAQMILRGDIRKRGLLSPVTDVPDGKLIEELRKRGIVVQRREDSLV